MIRSELKDVEKNGVEVEFNCETKEQFKLEIAGIITNALKHRNSAIALMEVVADMREGILTDDTKEIVYEDNSKRVN